ncbi:MAG: methyltransferase domain-containing protein, partial [Variovorax sp.]
VDRMLLMAEVTAADRVVDLGSGDGKIAIAAARNHGASANGLEFNPKLVELSNQRAGQAGVADKVSFKQADIFETDFSSASVVTMYLLPELNLRLRPILFAMRPGTRVVSHSFRMGDWQPDETSRIGAGEVFLWRIPANASGTWRVSGAATGAGAPQTLSFTQRFQVIDGTAAFGPVSAGIVRPQISGDALSFSVRDAAGQRLQVQARVAGDRLIGTMARARGAALAFEAVRTGAAEPIQGITASPQEVTAAGRVLNGN